MPSGFSDAAWSLMKSWPCRIWMRSPGSPTTRLTQACERLPGQRNTTTSPRFGVSPNTRPVSGSEIWIGSEAVP